MEGPYGTLVHVERFGKSSLRDWAGWRRSQDLRLLLVRGIQDRRAPFIQPPARGILTEYGLRKPEVGWSDDDTPNPN